MATLTLLRKDTALVVAGRSQATGDGSDLFNALWDDCDATYYNAKRDEYLTLETLIATAIGSGGDVQGTGEDGDPIQIGGMPSRPRPKQQ